MFQVAIPKTELVKDGSQQFTVYRIEVRYESTNSSWTVRHRFSEFVSLHACIRSKFPLLRIGEMPAKTFLTADAVVVEQRRIQLEVLLQMMVQDSEVSQSDEILFFLLAKPYIAAAAPLRTVLMPLPDKDFDPTECAVPWKLLSLEGYRVVFATENGDVPKADALLLQPDGVVFGKLGADYEAREFYTEMSQCVAFQHPIRWTNINALDYDGLYLVGGHAPGMKQYLESTLLMTKITSFWALRRPIAAICHGALLLARTTDESTGQSVLYSRRTTTLPKYMENLAYAMTAWRYGSLFRTYQVHCADEVKTYLAIPEVQFQEGPTTLGSRGDYFHPEDAFVCEDGNYLSARWPGDAYLIGRSFIAKLQALEQ
eukprot:TRINITY_DN13592_c0_g1_i1.p1 TRINITY_DN13592_c0_g1~~TRINITY_DN13592_c0_g1_i1.p1  ORF type:complete len:371 (-),score=51.66 TRINITY_DN13592_c0_g1_i1:305-1417(-)